MLVLSRGHSDKVVFPTLGITVEVLRVLDKKVRLGIEAPREIPVLRHELVGSAPSPERAASASEKSAALTHSMRNRLQRATLGLRLLQRMLEVGNADDAQSMIFKIFNELKALEEELAPANSCPTASPPAAKRHRALLVEDDVHESELLASYLRMHGFDVDTAIDGLQAMVHLAKNDRPDVVLLDMRMPRFDGRKTVSAIRGNPDYQSVKVFAVTGTDPSEIEVTVGPRGVDRWFKKPVDPEELIEAIHKDLVAEVTAA